MSRRSRNPWRDFLTTDFTDFHGWGGVGMLCRLGDGGFMQTVGRNSARAAARRGIALPRKVQPSCFLAINPTTTTNPERIPMMLIATQKKQKAAWSAGRFGKGQHAPLVSCASKLQYRASSIALTVVALGYNGPARRGDLRRETNDRISKAFCYRSACGACGWGLATRYLIWPHFRKTSGLVPSWGLPARAWPRSADHRKRNTCLHD